MNFRTGPSNRPTRLIATLLILSFGVGMVVCTPMPAALAGAAITAVGGCLLCSELWTIACERWRRRNRYDISLLDDTKGYTGPSRDNPAPPREEPGWKSEPDDAIYCHRCDVSLPASCGICPKCGGPL